MSRRCAAQRLEDAVRATLPRNDITLWQKNVASQTRPEEVNYQDWKNLDVRVQRGM